MNIVFTGQSGIEKEILIGNILNRLRDECGYSREDSIDSSKKFAIAYPVEKFVAHNPIAFTEWLQQQSRTQQEKDWSSGFEDLQAQLLEDKSKNRLISMHAVFYRSGKYFSPINWKLLKKFSPDLLITFIDDVYDIWWRLYKRHQDLAPSGSFRFLEIMNWRSIEVMMADNIAKNLFSNRTIPHYVVAIKHPVNMLLNLILRPEAMRVYASYPISRTRDDPVKRAEIDCHRNNLHENFVVFDPVSIDERVLISIYKKWEEQSGSREKRLRPQRLTLRRSDRWTVPSEKCSLPLLAEGVEYPPEIKGIDPEQIRELKDHLEVDNQIVWRDLRYVDQAHCVGAYRPNYGGLTVGGVAGEMSYANATKIQVYQFFPNKDGDSGPFQGLGAVEGDYDNFLKRLRQHEEKIKKYKHKPSHNSQIKR